jgi:hypothetical protein
LADGTFGPDGPVVEITKTEATDYEVTISDGQTILHVTNPIFDSEKRSLAWRNQAAADTLGEFANADLRFEANPLTGVAVFCGNYWRGDVQPSPGAENWRGHAIGVKPPIPVEDTRVPARVFEILGTIGLVESHPTSLFIWSRWQRACFTSRLTNSFVPKILNAIAGNEAAKS